MALSQQSKPMKTISLSALILIASPFCVVAQDAPQTNNSYYADVPAKIIDSANHVVFSKPSSALETRGQAVVQKVIAPALKTPVVEMSVFKNSKATLQWPGTNTAEARREPTYQSVGKLVVEKEFDIEVPEVSALNYLLKRDELIPDRIEEVGPTIRQTARQENVSGGEFKPLSQKSDNNIQMASRRRFKEILVRGQQEPTQDFPGVDQIVRPSPENTIQIEPVQNDVEIVPPPVDYDMISEPETLQPQANQSEVFQQQTVQPEAVQAEAASLDHIGMSQRRNSWDERPDTMRDTVDHFSPGGEPFAVRGLGGNPTFFGIDRRTCCDEWAGFCNCSGGLKVNPGHLGIPWLRSKDNCDSATGCGANLGRNARSGCGCASCNGR